MSVKVREKEKGSGIWWVYVAHNGRRLARKIGTKRAANEVKRRFEVMLATGDVHFMAPAPPDGVTFGDYAAIWMETYVRPTLKANTARGYESILEKHLLPRFKGIPLKDFDRISLRRFLVGKAENMSASRVDRIAAVLSGLFSHAEMDEVIDANPMRRNGRRFRKAMRENDEGSGSPNPFGERELTRYLATVREHYPRYYVWALTMALTGIRLGESLALAWDDIDCDGRRIEIRRTVNGKGELDTPKNGKPRRVSITPMLAEELDRLRRAREEEAAREGVGGVPEWVFANRAGNWLDPGNLRARMHYPACEKAGLERRRIHDLRHTYATIRIAKGHRIEDVSKSLGHASIGFTLKTYYKWMPDYRYSEVVELDELIPADGA